MSQAETEMGETRIEMSGTLGPGGQHYGKNVRGVEAEVGSRAVDRRP